MDSSIENATLEEFFKEMNEKDLVKAMVEARSKSDANFMKLLMKERERTAQAAHGKNPCQK